MAPLVRDVVPVAHSGVSRVGPFAPNKCDWSGLTGMLRLTPAGSRGVRWTGRKLKVRFHSYYLAQVGACVKRISMIHLSTAITYECKVLYTFDENDALITTSRPKRALIPLSGNVAGRYPLLISKPQVQTLGLPFR